MEPLIPHLSPVAAMRRPATTARADSCGSCGSPLSLSVAGFVLRSEPMKGGRWLNCFVLSAAAAHPSIPGVILELVDERARRIPRLEASGIAYYNGNLIVVDDTLNDLFVFDRTGRLSHRIESERFPRARAKFEDLTVDPSNGSFFAVGSHEGWDRQSLEDLSVLLGFRLVERDARLVVDEPSVKRLPLHRGFEQVGLWKPRRMKIEGLAYDPRQGYLYVGLRVPSDRARVYRFLIRQLERGGTDGDPPVPEEVVSFDAGREKGTPFCISALLWLPVQGGLLIATSTEDETTHEFLGNRLWFFDEAHGVRLVQDTFDHGMKAEGLTVGDGQLFISYDNDQDDTGIPSRLRSVPIEFLFQSLP